MKLVLSGELECDIELFVVNVVVWMIFVSMILNFDEFIIKG